MHYALRRMSGKLCESCNLKSTFPHHILELGTHRLSCARLQIMTNMQYRENMWEVCFKESSLFRAELQIVILRSIFY